MTTDARPIKPSKEVLVKFLTFIANESPVYSDGMRHIGYKPDTLWTWVRRAAEARPGDDRWMLQWPDPESAERVSFDAAIVLARSMFNAAGEARLRRDTLGTGTPSLKFNPDGSPCWEVCPIAVSEYRNRDEAETFGVRDWPYKHDPVTGGRIQVVEFTLAPAALRVQVARATLNGYNVADKKEIDARTSGVLIVQKVTGKSLPPYARARMSMAQQPQQHDSPLRTELLARLADNRKRVAAGELPRAHKPVDLGNATVGRDDPEENCS